MGSLLYDMVLRHERVKVMPNLTIMPDLLQISFPTQKAAKTFYVFYKSRKNAMSRKFKNKNVVET